MKQKRLLQIIMAFSVIGLVIAVYSLLHNSGITSGEFCTIGDKLNCDVVNKGPYSKFFGIPVALIGILGYLFLLIAAGMKYREPGDTQLSLFLLLASLGGLAFSLYLTGIEAFVLDTWCLLCLTSQAMILVITAAAVKIRYLETK